MYARSIVVDLLCVSERVPPHLYSSSAPSSTTSAQRSPFCSSRGRRSRCGVAADRVGGGGVRALAPPLAGVRGDGPLRPRLLMPGGRARGDDALLRGDRRLPLGRSRPSSSSRDRAGGARRAQRSQRGALVLAVPVYRSRACVRGRALGVALAFANALLFAAYIVLAHRWRARSLSGSRAGGLDARRGGGGHALGGWEVLPALTDPGAARGHRRGLCSSVIPYVLRPAGDAPAAARHLRADGVPMPATAT